MFFLSQFCLHMAYFWVHSFASLLYLRREKKRLKWVDVSPDISGQGSVTCVHVYTHLSLSFLQMCAMSGTKGSSGFGSQSNEHMESKTGMKKNKKNPVSQIICQVTQPCRQYKSSLCYIEMLNISLSWASIYCHFLFN